MAKKVIKEMNMAKFTYEIVCNVGSYQSVRIGGEWSVTETPTSEQVVNIDAELRQKVAEVVESRKAVPAPQKEEETKTEQAPTTEQPEDKRELVTTSRKDEARLKAILKKIQDGTPENIVRKYFRFDDKAEMLVKIALQDIMRS